MSWVETTLQPIATRFLKRWCGLARSANTGCIYLSKEKGGLELPSLLTLYKKLHVSKAAAYTCSRDPVVRAIASQKTRKEATQMRPSFRPYQVVVSAMQEDSGMSSYQLSRKVISPWWKRRMPQPALGIAEVWLGRTSHSITTAGLPMSGQPPSLASQSGFSALP